MFRTFEISDPRYEHDGLRLVTVKSAALRGRGDMTLWVPPGRPPEGLVVLLHGVYGSHWGWAQRGGVHRTAARMVAAGEIPAFVLAMPSDGLRGDGSGYLRHPDADFERWIVDEVPGAARLAVSELRPESPRFLTGLSMGGFGALRLGACYGDQYQAVSAHSAVTELSQLTPFVEEPLAASPWSKTERSVLGAMLAHRDRLPPFRFDCGSEDGLVEANRALHRALEGHGIAHEYAEHAGGHDWAYWEAHVEDSLRFFARHAAGSGPR